MRRPVCSGHQKLYQSLLGDGIAHAGSMIGLLHFVLAILVSPFRVDEPV
jgi:hypothetical protein